MHFGGQSKAQVEIAKQSSSHDIASSDAYTLNRILHAVPEGVEDILPMKAFPMESNLDLMGGCKWITVRCFQ